MNFSSEVIGVVLYNLHILLDMLDKRCKISDDCTKNTLQFISDISETADTFMNPENLQYIVQCLVDKLVPSGFLSIFFKLPIFL
jgi:hypothetical protein